MGDIFSLGCASHISLMVADTCGDGIDFRELITFN